MMDEAGLWYFSDIASFPDDALIVRAINQRLHAIRKSQPRDGDGRRISAWPAK